MWLRSSDRSASFKGPNGIPEPCVEVAVTPVASTAGTITQGVYHVGGDVAANGQVRAALKVLAAEHGLPFVAPPLWLCTDNAAMIAWAGGERYCAGMTDDLAAPARARWPLDPAAEKVRGAGVKA